MTHDQLQQQLASLAGTVAPSQQWRLALARSLLQRTPNKPVKVQQRLQQRASQLLQQATASAPPVAATTTPPQPHRHALQQLTASLQPAKPPAHDPQQPLPLDDWLREQEGDLLKTLGQASPANATDDIAELQAVRPFRQRQLQEFADRLVQQSIAEAPEQAGPLNPQMLAIRALRLMRDLSPHYLSRFVSQVDTLFWLEQADENAGKSRRKGI